MVSSGDSMAKPWISAAREVSLAKPGERRHSRKTLTVAMEELGSAGYQLSKGIVDHLTGSIVGKGDDIFLVGGGYHDSKAEQGGGDSNELHDFDFRGG